MSFQFDQETAVSSRSPGNFDTHLTSNWNIGENPNGGYAAASVLRAMSSLTDHATPLSVTTHYLRPAVGDADGQIEAETLRIGRKTSTLRAELHQEGKQRLATIATFGDHPDETLSDPPLNGKQGAPSLDIAPYDLPEPEECRSRVDLKQGIDLPIMSRLDVRLDPALSAPGESGRAETAGWIRFADGRPPDEAALGLFCDAFPPSPFGLLGSIGWVPTIELTFHVRRSPVDGWIRAHFVTRDLCDGFLIEDGVLWDESDRVVAQCRQLALLLQDGQI